MSNLAIQSYNNKNKPFLFTKKLILKTHSYKFLISLLLLLLALLQIPNRIFSRINANPKDPKTDSTRREKEKRKNSSIISNCWTSDISQKRKLCNKKS